MTKYVSRPVTCTAHRITEIRGKWENGNVALTLENGEHVEALKDMLARFSGNMPKVGDYWVISDADGYVYINPKDVFERKWADVSKSHEWVNPHSAQANKDRLKNDIETHGEAKLEAGLQARIAEQNKKAAKSTIGGKKKT